MTTQQTVTGERIGDFVEFFDDDARLVATTLQITLTSRNGRPMCGIPCHSAGRYIADLEASGLQYTGWQSEGILACESGLHSWIDEVGRLPADTRCTRCNEPYGDPE